MNILVVIFHVIACLALIVVVLLQAGKGASIGAVFGGSSQTVFGSGGAATFLGKMTTAVAVLFMLTSLFLATLAHQGAPRSVMEGAAPPAAEAPAASEAPAPPAPAEK